MESKNAAKTCAGCPLCNFTRKAKAENFFYKIGRMIQKKCPNCQAANKETGKDFQKGDF